MEAKFHGLGVALATPLRNGQLDEVGLRALVRHVSAGGAGYLVPLGTTGEAVTLSDEERELCLSVILSENQGRLPVLVGCGGNNTLAVAQTMENWAAKFEIDGFLSVSPYYNKPTQTGIIAHYKTLAAATSKPIILYNVPSRTGSNMLAATTLAIAEACPTVIGIKEASGDIEQGMALLRDRPEGFAVLSGDDSLALAQLACGYDGVVSVIANALPRMFSGMLRKALEGDFIAARGDMLRVLALIQLCFKEGNPVGIKAMLNALGICGLEVRQPLAAASPGLMAGIAYALECAGEGAPQNV